MDNNNKYKNKKWWLKANIMPEYGEPSDVKSVNCEDCENNADILLELECLRELEEIQVLINKLDFEDPFTAEKFVYDDSEITTEMISDEEILKAIQPNNQEKEEIE